MVFWSQFGSVSSTSDIAIDLLTLAMNKSGFLDGDYVIFRDAWGSYYIVWGELSTDGQYVYGTDIQYINYYCADTSQGIWQYDSGSDSSFTLGLSGGAFPTSSLENVGFASLVGTEYEYYRLNSQSAIDNNLPIFSSLLIVTLLALIFVRLGGKYDK